MDVISGFHNTMKRLLIACGVLAGIPTLTPVALAETIQCRCQAAFFCGADSCDPAGEAYCTNSDISYATEPAKLNVCIGEDCMSGPAMMSSPRPEELWLHGKFKHTAAPEQYPTSVTMLLDQSTGIGMIQASDESGIDQVSVICETAPDK